MRIWVLDAFSYGLGVWSANDANLGSSDHRRGLRLLWVLAIIAAASGCSAVNRTIAEGGGDAGGTIGAVELSPAAGGGAGDDQTSAGGVVGNLELTAAGAAVDAGAGDDETAAGGAVGKLEMKAEASAGGDAAGGAGDDQATSGFLNLVSGSGLPPSAVALLFAAQFLLTISQTVLILTIIWLSHVREVRRIKSGGTALRKQVLARLVKENRGGSHAE